MASPAPELGEQGAAAGTDAVGVGPDAPVAAQARGTAAGAARDDHVDGSAAATALATELRSLPRGESMAPRAHGGSSIPAATSSCDSWRTRSLSTRLFARSDAICSFHSSPLVAELQQLETQTGWQIQAQIQAQMQMQTQMQTQVVAAGRDHVQLRCLVRLSVEQQRAQHEPPWLCEPPLQHAPPLSPQRRWCLVPMRCRERTTLSRTNGCCRGLGW